MNIFIEATDLYENHYLLPFVFQQFLSESVKYLFSKQEIIFEKTQNFG